MQVCTDALRNRQEKISQLKSQNTWTNSLSRVLKYNLKF